MTKTEVGDNSLLAAIKDQLELGIDDCLKVNVKIRIGILEGYTESFIPRKKWDELLPSIVELHKGFTASVARQYQGQGLTDEEITSACESALKRAARKFDPNKDFAFISYAIWWMREGVLKTLKDKHSHVIKN